MKELIALDIDGTLTSELHTIPLEVEKYLQKISEEGVQLVLITGRSFSLAYPPIAKWNFSFLLAVHNGAAILQMPQKQMISSQYIDKAVISILEKIVQGEKTDFALYTGIENQDICYFRPTHFSPELREYVRKRAILCRENWIEVGSFEGLPLESLSAIKFFGDQDSSLRIQEQVEKKLSLHIPIIRDPIDRSIYIAQATHSEIDKGSVIDRVINGQEWLIIAGGDDRNDLPMLNKAHIKIVMASAPQDLIEIADVVAKPAEENGIIEALENARNNRL